MIQLDATARRIVTFGVLFVVLVFAGLTLAWCNSNDKAARSAAEGRVATGQANAGKGAVAATDGQLKAETSNRDLEARNRQDILNAENSNKDAGDAGSRGLRALCSRVRYQSDLRCVELRRADRADAAK